MGDSAAPHQIGETVAHPGRVYVCGNGGMRPQHAVLLAESIDRETVIRYLDRFLMFYTRTADRLDGTAPWFNRLEGGIDYLKSVIIDDVLGICEELAAEMQHFVDTYECEWKATIEDAAKIARFTHFVNADGIADENLVYVQERRPEARRPAGGAGVTGWIRIGDYEAIYPDTGICAPVDGRPAPERDGRDLLRSR